MSEIPVVLDTNVLVAALRSRRGASFRLLTLLDKGLFQINVSVPLVLEYEDVLSRSDLGLSTAEVRTVVDYLCTVGKHRLIHFLWRPYLKDPRDDMVLELAVTAECRYILTFNERDFQNIQQFGVEAMRPVHFLRTIGIIP